MTYSYYHRARKYQRKAWLAGRRGDMTAAMRYDRRADHYLQLDRTCKAFD